MIGQTHVSNTNSKSDCYSSKETDSYNSASIRSLNNDLLSIEKKHKALNLIHMESSVRLSVVKDYNADEF